MIHLVQVIPLPLTQRFPKLPSFETTRGRCVSRSVWKKRGGSNSTQSSWKLSMLSFTHEGCTASTQLGFAGSKSSYTSCIRVSTTNSWAHKTHICSSSFVLCVIKRKKHDIHWYSKSLELSSVSPPNSSSSVSSSKCPLGNSKDAGIGSEASPSGWLGGSSLTWSGLRRSCQVSSRIWPGNLALTNAHGWVRALWFPFFGAVSRLGGTRQNC